jgi:carbamoyl-phosphate synthase / aspartate carbamoyltransferase
MAVSIDGQTMALELKDGYFCLGKSFGANRSVAGELVFQTGMVGYPESLTDPSYRGQILVMTFPLVGNYGVPSREARDKMLSELPAYFESNEIHIAGLVVAAYSGEEYSHYLATCSLGTWLKEQNIPAIYGVDTRALTKRIRDSGSMQAKLMLPKTITNGVSHEVNGDTNSAMTNGMDVAHWKVEFVDIPFEDPNQKNLVAEGDQAFVPAVTIVACS